MENQVKVLAFMKIYHDRSSGTPVFAAPKAFLFQKMSFDDTFPVPNGLIFENGRLRELDSPLDIKKIEDVVCIFEQFSAIGDTPYKEDLEGHPFCRRHLRGNTFLYLDNNRSRPRSIEDVWLRHFLTSMCLTPPNFWSLKGENDILPIIAWISGREIYLAESANTNIDVFNEMPYAIGKFPRLTDWLIPPGVQIANSSNVRLGAHLVPGTIVKQEGYVEENGHKSKNGDLKSLFSIVK